MNIPTNHITPKVTLVGAGPGDPELISIKAVKALENADIVLYDALAHPELLNYATKAVKKLYVGKRVGNCSYKQEEINQLIVDSAFEYGHVVRLKGGDPFVFGRGHEEMAFAKKHDIEVQIVPGITSAVAVPEMEHIPLTTRGINESFWVITGTNSNLDFSKDIILAAQSSATVVILMGITHLQSITEIFAQHGKQNTPAAVIQNGTLENKKLVLGNVNNLYTKTKEAAITSPAIIIIGEVVALHPEFVLEKASKEWLTAVV